VKALCEKYGVPYVQEPVTKRAMRTLAIMVGTESMKQDYEYVEQVQAAK